jgi:hypothetical protein
MKIRTTQGVEADVDPAEIKRHAEMMGMKMPGNEKAHYADLTQEVIKRAQNELREMTGDEPEDLKDMFEFAVKHKLFGNRTETHLMCNFLKMFYGLMQQMTHE